MPLILSGDTGPSFNQSAAMPVGSVLQVVEGTTASENFTVSTSYVATNLSATITPKFSTSKILVTFSSTIYTSNSSTACHGTIFRDATDLASANSAGALFWGEGATGWVKSCSTILDSPASTSLLTYQLRIKTSNGSFSVAANRNNTRNSIILMEIAG